MRIPKCSFLHLQVELDSGADQYQLTTEQISDQFLAQLSVMINRSLKISVTLLLKNVYEIDLFGFFSENYVINKVIESDT